MKTMEEICNNARRQVHKDVHAIKSVTGGRYNRAKALKILRYIRARKKRNSAPIIINVKETYG